MSNETRSTLLDPITPQNAVLLLIDQQEGLLARVYEPEQMRGHLLGLARGAQLLGVPVIMTTALSAGTNGPVGSFLTKRYHRVLSDYLWSASRAHGRNVACRRKVLFPPSLTWLVE